jgi:hypothetical protein
MREWQRVWRGFLARERKENKYVVMTIEAVVVLNYLPRNANHQAKTLQLQTP